MKQIDSTASVDKYFLNIIKKSTLHFAESCTVSYIKTTLHATSGLSNPVTRAQQRKSCQPGSIVPNDKHHPALELDDSINYLSCKSNEFIRGSKYWD